MSSTAALLPLNPDYYHAWNMRKRSIKSNLTRLDLKEELAFNVDCIKANPKSYYSWYHRRWLLTLLFPEPEDAKHPTADLINHELHLCQLLLDLDKRNFHCWNYRKWLADHFKVPALQELDYTGRKIFQNFSNYSAWHRRSQLMLQAFPSDAVKEIIIADLKLVRNAYYTEPADQSAWFYLKWLIQASKQLDANDSAWTDMVKNEITNLNELLSIEPDAPLALLTCVRLKSLIGEQEGIQEALDHLQQVDQQRAGFYRHLGQTG